MKISKELQNLIDKVAERYYNKNNSKIDNAGLFNAEFTSCLKAELVHLAQNPNNKELFQELVILLKSKPFFLSFNDYFTAQALISILKEQNGITGKVVFIPTNKGKQCIKAWSEVAKKSINQ
jgi:hypothetical protein